MHSVHLITPHEFHAGLAAEIISNDKKIELSPDAEQAVLKCRRYLDEKTGDNHTAVYGINTGFGSLYKTSIGKNDLGKLQENLVKSHACGTGDEVPADIVKLMLLLKIQGLSYGKSGVQLETVSRLIYFYNHDILPVIYTQGSLGASGDLAPLAHLSLPLLGLGEVYYNNQKLSTAEVYKQHNLKPLTLKSKEGLALLNGTQFMSAYLLHIILTLKQTLPLLEQTAALSIDAFDGRLNPFSDLPHTARKQPGQLVTARKMREILKGSEIAEQPKKHVQDPYSFRCIPQVHGASYDAVHYAETVLNNEMSSVTDNPTIFPDEDEIISAGNFHGQPLAITLDFLCIALAELGSISERRTYKLVSGERELPEFLVNNPGLNSGFMIPQYTAASIVSQNKQYCTPSSIDSIDSSNGQEDHVSMGANAAVKALKVTENLRRIISIELLNAAQAIEFRRPLKTSPQLEKLLAEYRREIPFVKNDVEMYKLIHASEKFIIQKTQ